MIFSLLFSTSNKVLKCMNLKETAIVGSILLVSSCAIDNYSESGSGNIMVNSDGEELICEETQVTGTRFPRKDCRTEEAWAALKEKQRANTDEYGRQSREGSSILNDASDSVF